eukprot:scaffold10990_cov18-Tisochrysis_lutea.AAC.3
MCHTPGEWPFPRSQATNLNKNLGLNQSTPVYAPKAIQSTHHTLQVCGQGRRFLAIPLQASLLSGLAPPCPAHFSQLKNRLLSHTASGSHASALLYQPAWPCVRRYGLLREPGATRVPCEDAQVPQDPCGCAAQGHQGGCNQVVSVDRGDVKEGEQGQGSRTPGDACGWGRWGRIDFQVLCRRVVRSVWSRFLRYRSRSAEKARQQTCLLV